MKVITRKKQVEIAKLLAAIYYTAVHWQDEEWEDFVKCIVGNCAEIAFAVGGEHMMNIDVPALVMELQERFSRRASVMNPDSTSIDDYMKRWEDEKNEPITLR